MRAVLPYVGIGTIVTLVLVWDYVVNQAGAHNAFSVLWNSFTARVDSSGHVSSSPMLLVMMAFTWLVGALLALTETDRLRPAGTRYPWGSNATLYAGAVIGIFLVYGLIQGGRTIYDGLSGMAPFHRIADHIVVFDIVLLLMLLLAAGGIWLADVRRRPIAWFHATPLISLSCGLVLTVAGLIVIADANIQIMRADTYYKQGLAFEGQGQWESAVILYNEAAQIEPKEDYYYLFLGRALLEFASTLPAGTPTLPTDLSSVPTQDLLPLAEDGLSRRDREDGMRATYAVLLGARRLNPLNTDHTANLARLYRSWAFTDAVSASAATTNSALRQLVASQASGVDLAKLDQSVTYYEQATSLSPQNAQLWNELATVQYIRGNTQAALSSLDRSLALDERFYQTYMLRGDILADSGDKAGALDAYRQAAALRPTDLAILGAVGVYSAQTGDTAGALTAFDTIIQQETASAHQRPGPISGVGRERAASRRI